MISGVTVVTTLVCFTTTAHEAADAPSVRHSLRPLLSRDRLCSTSGASRRGIAKLCATSAPSLRGALATKQSILPLRRHGLLRGACHRARIRATRWLAMTVLQLTELFFSSLKIESVISQRRRPEAVAAGFVHPANAARQTATTQKNCEPGLGFGIVSHYLGESSIAARPMPEVMTSAIGDWKTRSVPARCNRSDEDESTGR